jgi:hypothetical protein
MPIDSSNYLIPGFLPEGEPLRIDAVLPPENDFGTWGLYVNYRLNISWLVTKASYMGINGWRVTVMAGIPTISWSSDFVKYHRCGLCDE